MVIMVIIIILIAILEINIFRTPEIERCIAQDHAQQLRAEFAHQFVQEFVHPPTHPLTPHLNHPNPASPTPWSSTDTPSFSLARNLLYFSVVSARLAGANYIYVYIYIYIYIYLF